MGKSLKIGFVIFGLLASAAVLGRAEEQTAIPSSQLIHQDKGLEEYLKYQGAPEEPITPGRVLRWLRGLRDNTTLAIAPPAFEFQPIVAAKDSRYRFIAAFAYKFQ